MKSLLYLFRRYKVASTLNLMGLILALTGSYILLTQIDFIHSYNHSIKDYENIRRVYIDGVLGEDVWFGTCARPQAESFRSVPQVLSVGYMRDNVEYCFDKNGSSIVAPSCVISDDMLTTINTELVDGTLDGAEAIDGGIIIPASLAEKYFGAVMVAGRSMKLVDGSVRNVVGVYKDFPVNCNFANAVYLSMGKENIGDLSNMNYSVYLRTDSHAETEALNTAIKKISGDFLLDKYGADDEDVKEIVQGINYSALSLDETYLNGHDVVVDRGSKTTYYILQLAVILLFVIALINFANFSMAQAPIRLRSINTRKVMGESSLSLRLQLIAEGCVVSLCAWVVSLLLVGCINQWEYIGQYANGSIAVTDNPRVVMWLTVASILVGILATTYSARYVTSFQPTLVLKGNFGLSPQGSLQRRILVGLQLVLSFVMLIFVGVLFCQRSYLYTSDYGYDKEEILCSDIYRIPESQQSALRSELEQINGVESVSFAYFILGQSDLHMTWIRGRDEERKIFVACPADWKLLRTMGIDIIEGRDFKETDETAYIVNEAMKKKYPEIELDKPLPDGSIPVVGVCKNFRASTTHVDSRDEAVAFVILSKKYYPLPILYVRLGAHTDHKALRAKVNQTLAAFSEGDTPPEVKFMDDMLEEIYQEEMRFITLMEISTLLAFLITVIGVFCLTMFETEYRRKEIAVRKVMGSSVGEVLRLFAQRYTLPLVISFLIAAPIGYYASERWLQNFAEHTPIHWWIFLVSFLVVSAVVLGTVVVQSWRVATMNPAQSLKTE